MQQLLLQKRNTDDLLLGNKLQVVFDDYFSKASVLADSRYQNNSSKMLVLPLK